MFNSNNWLQIIGRGMAIAFLVINFWIFGLTTFSASAASNTPTYLTEQHSAVGANRKARIQTVDDCKKYLIKGDKNTVANLDKPLDAMGNEHLVGALKASDKAEPTEAEVEFKRCLEEAGIAPKP